MQTDTQITGRTLISVLYGKLIDYVDDRSMKQIARDFFLSVTSAFVIGLATKPGLTLSILRWRDGVIPSLVFLLVVAVHGKALVVSLWNLGLALVPETEPPAEDRIEGIPTVELLDWLFTRKSLKVKEATEEFQVPQHRVEEIIKNLKRVGVLIAGPSNSSVLSSEFSRQDVASILKGQASARDIEPLFRRQGSILTSEPSAKAIEARVEEALSPLPAPGFTSRPLAAVS